MNTKNKKRIASAAVCALMCLPVINSTAPSFMPAPTSSLVMTMEADAASGKRSGKNKAYISCMIPGRMSFTVCLNNNKDIDRMVTVLKQMSYWTSGCNNGRKVVDFGNLFMNDPVSKVALYKASNIFRNAYGVSKSAGKAAKELKKLAADSRYKKRGLKVTIKQKGNWLVQVQ